MACDSVASLYDSFYYQQVSQKLHLTDANKINLLTFNFMAWATEKQI